MVVPPKRASVTPVLTINPKGTTKGLAKGSPAALMPVKLLSIGSVPTGVAGPWILP